MHQSTLTLQCLAHRAICLVDMNTGKFAGRVGVGTVGLHQVQCAQTVGLTDHKVFHAVIRRGVNGTGTGIGGDVITEDHRHLTVIDRMLELQQLQRCAVAGCQHFKLVHTPARHDVIHHFGSQDHAIHTLLGVRFHQRIIQSTVDRHRLVGGNGPGRGGPDHHRYRRLTGSGAEQCQHLVLIDEGKTHIYGGGGLVLIFHFGFSQCGLTDHTPVDRLVALHQMAVVDDLAQRAHDVGFSVEVHRQVGVVPVAQYAQADKIRFLSGDLLGGVLTTLLTEFTVGHLVTGLADQGFDLMLDRQPVTVPPWHVGGVKAAQGPGLDDHVLDHLVDRMTDMNITVGVGRTIVEDKCLASLALFTQLTIQVDFIPARQTSRFTLRQVAAHRECRFRQVECRFVIGHNRSLPEVRSVSARLGKPGADMFNIGFYLCLERVQAIKGLFGANEVQKLHPHQAAIQLSPCVVEQVRFQHWQAAMHGGTQPHITDGRQTLAIKMGPGCKHPSQRTGVTVHAHVRGWHTQLPPQFLAMHHSAGDGVTPTQQLLGQLKIIPHQCIANTRAADTLAQQREGVRALNRETVTLAGFAQHVIVAAAVTAKTEVIPNHEMLYRQPLQQ